MFVVALVVTVPTLLLVLSPSFSHLVVGTDDVIISTHGTWRRSMKVVMEKGVTR